MRRFDPAAVELAGGRGRFDVRGTLVELELPFTARHQAENALAALDAYEALGLPLARAGGRGRDRVLALARRGAPARRAAASSSTTPTTPTRPRCAPRSSTSCERAAGRRRVAILGEMAELGEEGPRYHREIGALLRELGIEVLVAVGHARARLPGAGGRDDALARPRPRRFDDLIRPGDAVLVKASRAAGLEGIAPDPGERVCRMTGS